MSDVIVIDREKEIDSTEQVARPKQPKGGQVVLLVCSDCGYDEVHFNGRQVKVVASLLGIGVEELKRAAVKAMISGNSEVVACYASADIAGSKAAQLNDACPFIYQPHCHGFSQLDEE
jgi:hypothetical protein